MISHVWKNGDEYCVDTAADLYAWDVTDIDMGTKAYVIETGKRMILNGNKEWKEFYGAGGGSGSGGSDGGDEGGSSSPIMTLLETGTGTPNEYRLNKTWSEVYDFVSNGGLCFVTGNPTSVGNSKLDYIVTEVEKVNETYYSVIAPNLAGGYDRTYVSTTPDDYPVAHT